MTKKDEKKFKELKNQCSEYELGWKRALADYENLKKQMSVELDLSKKRICISFAEDLLPVMDNFDQAVNHQPESSQLSNEMKNWLQGIVYIKKQFEEVFESLGAKKIKVDGIFDPDLHEAVGTESIKDQDENQIIKEIQTGWKIEDRVIRPARVIINQKVNKE